MSDPKPIVDPATVTDLETRESRTNAFETLARTAFEIRNHTAFWMTLVQHSDFANAIGWAAKNVCQSFGKERDESLLNDVSQSVIVKIITKYGKRDSSIIDWGQNVAAWFQTVLERHARDSLRGKSPLRQREQTGMSSGDSDIDPLASVIDEEGEANLRRAAERTDVRAVMSKLSEEEQAVLRLYYFEGWTQAKIAADRGCAEGTVSKLLASARDEIGRFLRGTKNGD